MASGRNNEPTPLNLHLSSTLSLTSNTAGHCSGSGAVAAPPEGSSPPHSKVQTSAPLLARAPCHLVE